MWSELAQSQSNEGLHALDPDLPFLAAEAAVEIDNILSNRSQDMTAIQSLADRLNNSIDIGNTGPPRSLMDAVTLTVLGEAIAESMRNKSLEKVEDLLKEAAEIATSLSRKNPKENLKELEQARDFCVALSGFVMAYHKSIRDLRPSHPFRK